MRKLLFLLSCILAFTNSPAQTGVFRWVKNLDGAGGAVNSACVVYDISGNILTTGDFAGKVDFDPGPGVVYLTSADSDDDIFITKSDPSGNLVWIKQIGGTSVDRGISIVTDPTGNIYACGTFQNTVDFDPGAGTYNLYASIFTRAFILKLDPSGNFIWAKSFTSGGATIVANAITLDASGNIYCAGTFTSSVDFDPGSGTYSLVSTGGSDCFVSKFDAAGNFILARNFGGTGVDILNSIAIDGTGNILSTGHFSGTSDFDPDAGIFNLTSSGSQDIFISKIDGAGNFVWAKQIGGTSSDIGYSITVDGANNVIATGSFTGTVDFDPGAGTFNLSAGAFILKLDASGIFSWAKSFSGSNKGNSILVDGAGDILSTGRFSSTVDFDPGAGTFNLISSGGNDIYISKLNNAGDFVWAKSAGGSGFDEGNSIAVDATDNYSLTGRFSSTIVDFDPGPGTFNIVTSANSNSQFVLSLNFSGIFLWAKSAGKSASATINDMCLDASGNIISIGIFAGTVDFDGGSGVFNLLSNQGSVDIFITKYDSSGNFIWAKQFGGSTTDNGNSIEIDGSGNLYCTGSFEGTVDFDPGAPVVNLTSVGGVDIFIAKLNSSGNFVWAKKIGGTSTDHARSLALDPSGNIVTTGYFLGTVDFDPGTGTFNLVGSLSSESTYILKLNSSGNFIWAKKFTAQYSCEGFAIETDISGNVITTGTFYPSSDFDPGAGTFNLTTVGYDDIFVSKLDASGNFLWAKSFGTANYDGVTSLVSDASGNTLILGDFYSSGDFDPGVGIFNLTSLTGGRDIFVSKLDPSGNFLWAKKFGIAAEDKGKAITIDNAGNSYFAGSYGSSIHNVVIHKLDTAGNSVWEKIINGPEEDIGYAIAVDPVLNVYTAGTFYGTVDFNPDPFVFNLTSYGTPDAFILKMAQCILPPANITPAGPTTFCAGGNVVLNANTGSGLSYQWRNNGTDIPGATLASYTATTAGYFTVVITNSCGPSISSEVEVAINPLPSAINNPAGPTTFCAGGSVLLSANVGTGLTYQWKNNGVDIPGQTNVTYTTNSTGSYTVVVTNANGCSKTSPVVVVTVNPVPTATIIPAGPTTVCGAGAVLLNANTGTGLTYQWKNNGVNISGQTNSSYTATAAGNYTVVVTNSCGSSTSSAVSVIVDPLPSATITPAGATTFCSGGSVILDANTGSGLTYQWKNNGVNIPGQTNSSYTADTTGNYTVVVTNSNNCSNTSSPVVVTENTMVTINIHETICPGLSYTLPDGQIVNTTGIYSTLIPNGGGCDSLVIVNLTVSDLVAPVVANCPVDFTSCNPVSWVPPQFTDNCFYTATSNYVPGTFFTPGVHTITYSATDAGNNTTSCSFNVTVLADPVLPDSLRSDKPYNNICINQNITLTVYGGTGTREWFIGSCGGTPLTAYSGMSSITVSPLTTTTYFVRGANSCNSTACLSLTVVVNNGPPGTCSVVSMPPIGYIGGSGTIVCNVDPTSVFYRWNLLNGPSNAVLFNGSMGPVETTSNSVNVNFILAQNKYNIRVFSGNACGRSNFENISIKGTVEPATCLNGPLIVCPLQSATYSVVACPIPNATGYQWTIQPPSAGTIISGQGSSVVNIQFAAGYTSAQVCVAGLSQSSIVGPTTCVTVAPATSVAGPMAGDISPCMGSTENYTVMPVSGATGYLWTTTIPGAVVSGTSTTGTVQFPSVPFTGNVCVQSLTACGPGLPSCTAITSVTPGVPGPISGPVSNVCGISNINYSLNTNDANSYSWTLPPGISLVSGGNSNSVNVNFNAGTVGPQTISVQATYDCNIATSSIIVDGTPGIPGVTPETICPGTDQYYTASSGGPGLTYSWTITGDATSYCTNSNCSQFYVEWLPGGCTLSVTASNSCGSSTYSVLNNCRITNQEISEFRIYPNPTDGEFVLEFESYEAEIKKMLITDQTGRILMKKDISSTKGMMQQILNLGNVEPGIYNLTLTDGDGNFRMERITLLR